MSILDAPIGTVPILWNNADLFDLAPETAAATVLDDIARLGFDGTQFGRGFPEGDELREALAGRKLRFAELYSAVTAGPDGLAEDANEVAHRDLARLVAAGGEVLVVAVDGGGERDGWSGRVADGAPQWKAAAFEGLAQLLGELVEAAPAGVRIAFHPHTATWVEAPDEVEALATRLPDTGAGLCLDVGHYLVGGGEPVRAIRRYGSLVTHVHLKDVDPAVLARLQSREIDGFSTAVRERIFTELGNGALDLRGVLATLDAVDFDGWLMVEQDSSWLQPAEAAAVGGRVLRYALSELDR
ncbi:MAG TPA: sugar phosphate isomerase/epimerase [Candidatus Limnocylindrales bacterium]|nr:sugar phosphate isomerase/epimerase [Candidatus Limnocylindrales bacterium]